MKSIRIVSVIMVVIAAAAPMIPQPAAAQIVSPRYEQCRLDGIFPAGGQAGTTVTVEFMGFDGGLQFPTAIVIDGPPGLSASNLQSLDPNRITADITIASDAAPGRRALRVANEQSGLTNFAWFVVSRLPEQLEAEPNNSPEEAQVVVLPMIMNGRITPEIDVDCFRFTGARDQRVSVCIQAAALDVHGQGSDWGLVDASLSLLSTTGSVIAEGHDNLGLDPFVEATLPSDGEYVVQVELRNYRGFPQAVYRCVIGAPELPIAAYPPGGVRGEAASLLLRGSPLSGDVPLTATFGTSPLPVQWMTSDGPGDSGLDVPVLCLDGPSLTEQEPNDDPIAAQDTIWPVTVLGCLETPGDVDCFSFEAADTTPIRIETISQRWLRAPVDTMIEVFDASGNELLEVDDGVVSAGYESFHLYRSPDTFAVFTPPAPGRYVVRVSEMTSSGDSTAVYALQLRRADPDFDVVLFPDAVPVWGPGSTAAVLIKVDRLCGFAGDVELTIEGLPEGWRSSRHVNSGAASQAVSNYKVKQFLTITAPPDAMPGQVVEFQVVGRSLPAADAAAAEQQIVRSAIPLTLMYTSDTGLFRASPQARAAVARSQGPYLETDVASLTSRPGDTLTVPVRIVGNDLPESISLTACVATDGVACSVEAPQTMPIAGGVANMPIRLPAQLPPGNYGLVVALTWRSDIRIGMPGPCTPLIELVVEAAP